MLFKYKDDIYHLKTCLLHLSNRSRFPKRHFNYKKELIFIIFQCLLVAKYFQLWVINTYCLKRQESTYLSDCQVYSALKRNILSIISQSAHICPKKQSEALNLSIIHETMHWMCLKTTHPYIEKQGCRVYVDPLHQTHAKTCIAILQICHRKGDFLILFTISFVSLLSFF
jgi:hypothetical protein